MQESKLASEHILELHIKCIFIRIIANLGLKKDWDFPRILSAARGGPEAHVCLLASESLLIPKTSGASSRMIYPYIT